MGKRGQDHLQQWPWSGVDDRQMASILTLRTSPGGSGTQVKVSDKQPECKLGSQRCEETETVQPIHNMQDDNDLPERYGVV